MVEDSCGRNVLTADERDGDAAGGGTGEVEKRHGVYVYVCVCVVREEFYIRFFQACLIELLKDVVLVFGNWKAELCWFCGRALGCFDGDVAQLRHRYARGWQRQATDWVRRGPKFER